jgi:hypothetical protein
MGINDRGPAFPTLPQHHGYSASDGREGCACGPGMTLREYYVGQAIVGLTAHNHPDNYAHAELAQMAVGIADALISELAE